MSRSLRHPFRGSRRYLRPESAKTPRRKPPRQPRLRQSRFSVESALSAPDTTESRPGLRLRIIALVMALLFCLLALRLWALQALQAPAAQRAVSAVEMRTVPVEPTRGLILDRYGNPLVGNTVTEQITLSRIAAAQHPEVIGRLAALTGETTAQVEAAINDKRYSPYRPVPILSDAPPADVLYLMEHPAEFPGVTASATTQRNYPQQEIPGPAQAGYPAEQALGYVGTIGAAELQSRAGQGYQPGDPFGQSGLEYEYESALRGSPGAQQLEVNPQNQVVGTFKTTPATPGDNLVTNIDTNLQQVADNALATQILHVRSTPDPVGGKPRKAPNGSVVVLDPRTGAVLALSSYPFYDPNVWVGGISDANYAALQASGAEEDYPLQTQLAPGSTWKLVTATAALQAGLINTNTEYDDTGTYTAPNCTGPNCTLSDDIGDRGGEGYLNVTSALTVSSDVFFYNIGATFWDERRTYGDTPVQGTAAQYGFGGPTGIDLPGETSGRVDSQAVRIKLHTENPTAFPYDTWYTGDNMELAFGQGGTVVTPLQLATAYATFANGGTRYAPQLAAGIVSPSGKVVARMAPKVAGHVAYSPDNYAAMLQGFEGVVANSRGTGYGAFVGNGWDQQAFPLAGKTGTSSANGQEPTSWFVAFGPLPNPQYVVACDINQGGYGADAAAPVVRHIFDYLAAHPVTAPGLPPPPGVVTSSAPVPLPGSGPPAGTAGVSPGPANAATTPTTAPGG